MKRILSTVVISIIIFIVGFLIPTGGKDEEVLHEPLDTSLEVHYIDVGQGDAALISCKGEYLLIDAGDEYAGDVVTDYLDDLGVTEIDYAIASHNHTDHIGGMDDVLYYVNTEVLYISPTNKDNEAYRNMMASASETGTEVLVVSEMPPDISFDLGGAEVSIIGPYGSYLDMNESSLVVYITYGGTSFIFTGDMGQYSEREMLEWYLVPIDVTVLKVAHHGSAGSSTFSFLGQLDPQFAIISVGEGNEYGHPHEETLLALNNAGATIYRTDEYGTILAVSNGSVVEIETER